MKKCVTFAICGCGQRGLMTYAPYAKEAPDQMKIVAGADPDSGRLGMLQSEYGVPAERCFPDGETLLQQEKLADVMIVSTQDTQHASIAIAALKKGYHLVLEKPISPDLNECKEIERVAKEENRIVIVCHVLRYTQFYACIKKLLEEGEIGQLVTMDAVEGVGYWHYTHSYVRGNWRNQALSSPMILAKSCHDMDLFRWLADAPCTQISSVGDLTHFTADHAPVGCALYCADCENETKKKCPFDAQKIYIMHPVCGLRKGNTGWPCDVVVANPTEETLCNALKRGPYGRCVYHCDNDVVDHQVVLLQFENGVTASFTMSGFTQECHRTIRIMGTKGEIYGDMDKNELTICRFGAAPRVIRFDVKEGSHAGHGGGDFAMMQEICTAIATESPALRTAIDVSVESHAMALAAEQSRMQAGKQVTLT